MHSASSTQNLGLKGLEGNNILTVFCPETKLFMSARRMLRPN
jgi:hypothetical protein